MRALYLHFSIVQHESRGDLHVLPKQDKQHSAFKGPARSAREWASRCSVVGIACLVWLMARTFSILGPSSASVSTGIVDYRSVNEKALLLEGTSATQPRRPLEVCCEER